MFNLVKQTIFNFFGKKENSVKRYTLNPTPIVRYGSPESSVNLQYDDPSKKGSRFSSALGIYKEGNRSEGSFSILHKPYEEVKTIEITGYDRLNGKLELKLLLENKWFNGYSVFHLTLHGVRIPIIHLKNGSFKGKLGTKFGEDFGRLSINREKNGKFKVKGDNYFGIFVDHNPQTRANLVMMMESPPPKEQEEGLDIHRTFLIVEVRI